jgi:hypothetical protein
MVALGLSSWKSDYGKFSGMLILALPCTQILNSATLETISLKGLHKETSLIKKQE